MDIKLKNKKSISKKLLNMSIIVFIIITIIIMLAVNKILDNPNNTDNLIYTYNSIYVELSQNTNINSPNIKSYIDSLSHRYNVAIVLSDVEGNIKIKSENVSVNKIDNNKIINDSYIKSGDANDFTKEYKLNEELTLTLMSNRNVKKDILSAWLSLFVPISLVLIGIYIIIRYKLKELTYICNGIIEIGKGNLKYKLEKKSEDEFGVLVDEINNMSSELKEKIENEKNIYKFKNNLITNISHDLKTPLTSLLGYIQLANNEKIDNELKNNYVKKALCKSERIQILIEELFEYSKLESGEVKLEKEKVDIIEMIEQCIGECSNVAKKKQLCFKREYTEAELLLYIDPQVFVRVLENILENALKYSKSNTNICINIKNGESGTILVFKNISKKAINSDINKLFERFYRADESRNQNIEGSGLGLFISKSIVELHGGQIEIRMQEDIFEVSIYIKD